MVSPPDPVCSPETAVQRARALGVNAELLGAFAAAAVRTPPLKLWRRILVVATAAVGVGLAASGLITFVAYNWAALGRLVRIALIEVLLIATTFAAARLLPRLAGQLALSLATVCVGGLLATFGQTYLTGADPFQLFLLWAALGTPWALVARFEPLNLLLSLVLGTGVVLAWQQLQSNDGIGLVGGMLSLWLLAAVLVAAWEWRALRAPAVSGRRWLPRVWAAFGAGALALAAAWEIIDSTHAGLALWAAVAVLSSAALALWRYHAVTTDVFMQTVVIGVLITVVTCVFGRLLLEMDADVLGVALLSLLVIAQMAVAAFWLRKAAQRGQNS